MGKPRRRSVAPAPAIAWLPGSTEVPVVGETFRADAIRAVAKRLQPADEVRAWLVPEPHNPHDRHAVAVHLEGVHAGYLPRQVAAAVQPVLLASSARHNGQLVACPARVHCWHLGPQVVLFLDTGKLGLTREAFEYVPEIDQVIMGMLPRLDNPPPVMTGRDQAGRELLTLAEARLVETDHDFDRPAGAWQRVENHFLQAATRLQTSHDPLAAAAWAGVARARRYQKGRRDDRIGACITALYLDRANNSAWAELIDLASSAPHVPTLLELFRRMPVSARPKPLSQLIALSRGRDRLGNMHPEAGERLRAGLTGIAQADVDKPSMTKLRRSEQAIKRSSTS